jgi:hypothetical protein
MTIKELYARVTLLRYSLLMAEAQAIVWKFGTPTTEEHLDTIGMLQEECRRASAELDVIGAGILKHE